MEQVTLKERLKAGETVVGTWCLMPSPQAVNVIAKAGLDFVIIDMEHGGMGIETASAMAMAAEAEGCRAILRVPLNEESIILRCLELGVDGIIAPHISNTGECMDFVSAMKYPPIGKRGFSPYPRAGAYHSTQAHTIVQNARVLSIAIVEGLNEAKKVYDIASTPGIDVVYVGTYDISSALGIPGEVKDYRVVSILKDAVREIIEAGKIAGCMGHTKEDLEFLSEYGVKFQVVGVDTNVLYEHYKQFAIDRV